ncbi:hypothetical protein [Vibrio rotiferianus]|uniref:hypothetical protein n=1 Tax=Vibrio rotiferianus TaxID=190895 RepID=UPI00406A17C1
MNEDIFSIILDNFSQLSVEQISILKDKLNKVEINSPNTILSEDELNALHDVFTKINDR